MSRSGEAWEGEAEKGWGGVRGAGGVGLGEVSGLSGHSGVATNILVVWSPSGITGKHPGRRMHVPWPRIGELSFGGS